MVLVDRLIYRDSEIGFLLTIVSNDLSIANRITPRSSRCTRLECYHTDIGIGNQGIIDLVFPSEAASCESEVFMLEHSSFLKREEDTGVRERHRDKNPSGLSGLIDGLLRNDSER